MLNINTDKANKILAACKPLEQYSLFVEAVRRHTAIDKEKVFENAIKECIENDILKEYLQRKSREVMNMLLSEYDYDTDIAVRCEEAGRRAFAQGISQGMSQGSRQKALETAKILKQLGDSIQKIATATGLSQEEVAAIE